MAVQIKKRRFLTSRLGGSLSDLFAGLFAFLMLLLTSSALWAETRSLKIYYIHTREKAEIVYKKDGRYVDAGLKKLNHLLRDWRRNEPTNMDPRLFDLVWQVYRLSGSRDYIHVVSAYRSPSTNNMLRSRSANSGVAKNSQHTLGRALDFYLPDVNLAKLRGLGLKQEGGGVGYYPTSGSPFIHMDVGSVRHWPRMNRKELMALFPDGKTIHVPSDGKPLDGYNQALASYNARKGAPAPIVIAKQEQTNKDKTEKKSLFAGLFSRKKSQEKEPVAASRTEMVVAVAQPPQEPVMLPEEDAPIPAFSPLKQAGNASNIDSDEFEEDAIAALLVAEAALPPPLVTSPQIPPQIPPQTQLPEMSFVPIPTLKTPSSPTVAQRGERQMAHLPTLSRPPSPPLPPPVLGVEESEPEDALAYVIANARDISAQDISARDIVPLPDEGNPNYARKEEASAVGYEMDAVRIGDGIGDDRQDLVQPVPASDVTDFAEIDGDVIRSLIAEAMILAEADSQMVASITPRTTPKSDKPRIDELGKLIAQDEVQRMIEASASVEEIRQIPEVVFVSGLQKGKKQPIIARLGGKAINFPPVARIAVQD